MRATQHDIDRAVAAYNQATQAHKRVPVETYVHKRLAAGETVELSSGAQRWTTALQLAGTPDAMQARFLINPALPEAFRKHAESLRERFEKLLGED